jgi:parallel beta-helix repeat protein
MQKKLMFTALCLTLALALVYVKPASPQTPLETILIRPDGTVYPATAPIQQNGNTYTFTDNVYAAVKILRSNIVLDGAGYTLWGPYNGGESDLAFVGTGGAQNSNGALDYTIGVDLGDPSVEGIVVENLNIKNHSIGMYMWTKNNTVVGNSVSQNVIGILLSGSNETITNNILANNQRGLFFGFNNPGSDTIPPDIFIYRNTFESNIIQLNGCECEDYNTTEAIHNWDHQGQGNFWSDYNGTDANGDGIGDTPYTIDVLNQDRYPLMQIPSSSPTTAPQLPTELIVFVIAFAIIAAVTYFGLRLIRRRA